MQEMNLQQKVTELSQIGYDHLGKNPSDPITMEDLDSLKEGNLYDAVMAIQITMTRNVAKENGSDFEIVAPYGEVFRGLDGQVPADDMAETIASYFIAVYNLGTDENKKMLTKELTMGVKNNDPYAKEVFAILTK